MKTYSVLEIRRELDSRLRDRNLTKLAEEIGVGLSALSMAKNGAPLTGKILKWLGFEKVREPRYRRIGK